MKVNKRQSSLALMHFRYDKDLETNKIVKSFYRKQDAEIILDQSKRFFN